LHRTYRGWQLAYGPSGDNEKDCSRTCCGLRELGSPVARAYQTYLTLSFTYLESLSSEPSSLVKSTYSFGVSGYSTQDLCSRWPCLCCRKRRRTLVTIGGAFSSVGGGVKGVTGSLPGGVISDAMKLSHEEYEYGDGFDAMNLVTTLILG
jgi:hypothetical protein